MLDNNRDNMHTRKTKRGSHNDLRGWSFNNSEVTDIDNNY